MEVVVMMVEVMVELEVEMVEVVIPTLCLTDQVMTC